MHVWGFHEAKDYVKARLSYVRRMAE
ncbi:hypothetical protein PAE1966a [Pyrobaculum aerophilum str. IM2]|uniref:Uncharacterized protein n=1 Tax=Pyrobaculum aerophilum (strain ATCC 51768 / DSM 7523 / JCM 9630 / CIP 104966 / NBRC 100827 / IM2) TaxID=178306 RepID=Q8ZW56_PYRAE|nr:hypothetical protein PAE1966a [Pyrobaculum aerophilum str. IM2]